VLKELNRFLTHIAAEQPPAIPQRRANGGSIATVEILSMAGEALWSNKLRTGLTMLGMIIGISSVIGITPLGRVLRSIPRSDFARWVRTCCR
jgi:hypothetical protein